MKYKIVAEPRVDGSGYGQVTYAVYKKHFLFYGFIPIVSEYLGRLETKEQAENFIIKAQEADNINQNV